MSVYDWIDPWEAVAQAQHFRDHWEDREEEHRLEMRAVSMACADATYQIRRQAEAMMDPILRAKMFEPPPPIMVNAEEFARMAKLVSK